MRIVLLGKNGMLGSCMLKELAAGQDFEMFAFDKSDFDICDPVAIENIFGKLSPDFVINCAAYTAVDGAEENREEAFRVNAEAVAALSAACKNHSAVFLHFSTDYVFDGETAVGFKENSPAKPINVYGESKLAGEKELERSGADYYIVRSSWLFGPNGKNFVDTIVDLAIGGKDIKVVNDQIGSPTYTHDLARATIKYFLNPHLCQLERHHDLSLNEEVCMNEKVPFGVYHLTNSGSCSWFELTKEIIAFLGTNTVLEAIDSESFQSLAKRPKVSILLNTKLDKLRPWQEALKAYLSLKFAHLKK